MQHHLDFEDAILQLQTKIEELRHADYDGVDIARDISNLEEKLYSKLSQIYSKLTPWQKVQVARHPSRPHFSDYVKHLFDDYIELSGDRLYGEDKALLGGVASFNGQSVMILGQERGGNTQERITHNFGMASPEGYRKAIRLMGMADKFSLPVITLVDTAGAYPGKEAEERGQAEAIARSIQQCLSINVPLISIIIGEGGSGGAIAIAAADKVAMLEHSIYSVISPEGCASILWHDAQKAQEAATALRITAQDLHHLGVIDTIIAEPVGGAHREKEQMMDNVATFIHDALQELSGLDNHKQLRRNRYIDFTANPL